MYTLQDVINTLNQIEVRGEDNMDKLLGSIMALRAIQQSQAQAAQETKEDKGE